MLSFFYAEIKYYIRSFKELAVICNLFVSILLLAPLTLPAGTNIPDEWRGLVLWIGLLVITQTIGGMSWQRHDETGELAQFQLLPWPLEGTVLMKIAAAYAATMMPVIAIVPIAMLGFGTEEATTHSLACLAVGGLGLTGIYQLGAGLMTGYRRSVAMLGIIALPFAMPIMIFGASAFHQGLDSSSELWFMLGYALCILPFACVAIAASLRTSH